MSEKAKWPDTGKISMYTIKKQIEHIKTDLERLEDMFDRYDPE